LISGEKKVKTIDESLEALASVVLDEARAESEQILKSAAAQREAQRAQAKAQSRAEREEILARANEEARRIYNQAQAEARLMARKKQLAHREELLANVFDHARQQLDGVTQWNDYGQIARELLHEALLHLEADTALVRADATTRGYLTDDVLKSIAQELNVHLQFGEPLEQGTGVIVETPDGHRRYDNTLERRLSRLQRSLRAKIHHLLIGESQ
jgi:vacuolar-type H+-ATPase subunit E/Vma4